jgi:hypothetical protein
MTAEAVAKALGGRKAGAAWMCGVDGAPPSFTARSSPAKAWQGTGRVNEDDARSVPRWRCWACPD